MNKLTIPPQAGNAAPLLTPTLSEGELALLLDHASRARIIFEYGSGHSTGNFARLDARRIVSIDSDPSWIERLRLDPSVAEAEGAGRLSLLHADIGPVKNWGKPRERNVPRAGWAGYALMPWQREPGLMPDLVFVDGRFRVASVLASFLFGGDGMTVLVHDFHNRPHYHAVLDFAEVIAETQTLVALRRAAGADPGLMMARLREAFSDWR